MKPFQSMQKFLRFLHQKKEKKEVAAILEI